MHYSHLREARAELTGPGGPFEITRIPILGNAILAYRNAPASVRDVWLSTRAFSERPYLIYNDECLTYGEAHRITASLASWLIDRGIRQGDRVAIAMRNYPEWMLVYWACLSVGITIVGMNAWWTREEMEYGLEDSRPKALFVDRERFERLRENPAMADGIITIAVRFGDFPEGMVSWQSVIGADAVMPEASIDPDTDACIFYTSGTTGFPKGAQLTHRGCVSNLLNIQFAGASTALAMQRATGLEPPATPPVPVTLITTPLFHVTANNCSAYAATAAGGVMVLMYRWDAGEALRLIEKHRVSAMSGVPVMARELISHPDFERTDLSSLVALGGGGAQLPPDLVHKIDTQAAMARPNTGYGMTETCGIITSVSGDFFVDKPDSAGPSMPNFEVKCVDDNANEVAPGEVGELWVRGSSVIKGYINRPEATAASITDGWLHTGDIARIDEDGFIFIVDRKKDMVLRGGENVYCAEVETALYRHPAIAECCVFGVPDERLGEEVGAAIVLKPSETVNEEALRAHCGQIIARHKVPRYIWILDEPLPRNANGKFLKRELRDRLSKA